MSVFLKEKETLKVFGTLLSQLKDLKWGQTTLQVRRMVPHFQKCQYLKIEKRVVRFFLLLASSGFTATLQSLGYICVVCVLMMGLRKNLCFPSLDKRYLRFF